MRPLRQLELASRMPGRARRENLGGAAAPRVLFLLATAFWAWPAIDVETNASCQRRAPSPSQRVNGARDARCQTG